MAIKNPFKREKKAEKPVVEESTIDEVESLEHESVIEEDRSAFNCKRCKGEGIAKRFASDGRELDGEICGSCHGTGKA